MKKKFALLLIGIIAISIFSGCGKKKEEAPVYQLIPVDESQLEEGKYYVRNANSFYELPVGASTITEGDTVAKKADPSRVMWFREDDVLIPTLYKDDVLVYVTPTLPDNFVWERFYDDGYTFGLCGMVPTSSGNYSFSVQKNNIYGSSDFATKMLTAANGSVNYGDVLVLDKVNSQSLNYEDVSDSGVVIGHNFNETCDIDLYFGSTYWPLEDVAVDTHAFHSFELYESSICNYMQANYIQVVVPDSLMSGYYFINGTGFVKYVNKTRSQGMANEDFNAAYYIYDEDGNVYTRDDVKENPDGETTVPDYDTSEYFTNSIYVDCSNQNMKITFSYTDAVRQNADGSDIVLADTEVGIPDLKLIAPDETEYIFHESNKKDKSLECDIEQPLSGEWLLKIYNARYRTFDIRTVFESGHNDSLIHTGNGNGTITYYNPRTMEDGTVNITWTNTNQMPSNITIVTPDGAKMTKETLSEEDYSEGRGFANFNIGYCPYGDYTIKISGLNLGRVRVGIEGNDGIEKRRDDEDILSDDFDEDSEDSLTDMDLDAFFSDLMSDYEEADEAEDILNDDIFGDDIELEE